MKFEEIGTGKIYPLPPGEGRVRVSGLPNLVPSPGAPARWLSRRPLPEGEGLPPKERNGHEGAEYDNPSTNQRGVHSPGDSRARIAANDGSDEHDPSLCPPHFSRNDE